MVWHEKPWEVEKRLLSMCMRLEKCLSECLLHWPAGSKNWRLPRVSKVLCRLPLVVPYPAAMPHNMGPYITRYLSRKLAPPQIDEIHPFATWFHTGTSVRYPILQHTAWSLCDTPLLWVPNSFGILSLAQHEKYPPAQNQYMQEKILGELIFARIHVGACIRTRANTGKYFWGGISRVFCQILRGNSLGANTCRACVRTRATTGKCSWRIIYALVSCQGVLLLGH